MDKPKLVRIDTKHRAELAARMCVANDCINKYLNAYAQFPTMCRAVEVGNKLIAIFYPDVPIESTALLNFHIMFNQGQKYRRLFQPMLHSYVSLAVNTGFIKVTADISSKSRLLKRILMEHGFRLEGTHTAEADGTHDMLHYGMFASEWRMRHGQQKEAS